LLPFDLEDWAPLCHIHAFDSIWSSIPYPSDESLRDLGLNPSSLSILESIGEATDREVRNQIHEWLEHSQISAKCSVFLGANRESTADWLEGMSVDRSSTGRIRNVFLADGRHVLSPRLQDGGISLTNEGAKDLHSLGVGTPRLVLQDDAIPFVRDGRNVIHGFIERVDESIVPGLACLIVDSNGDLNKAVDNLRKSGIAKAEKKGTRDTKEGLVYSYIHAGGRLGVLLELNCETDFVAKTEGFKELAHNLSMQIAAGNPVSIDKDTLDGRLVEREKEIYTEQAKAEGKPEKIIEKMVEGRLMKFFQESCLLEQTYIKDSDKKVNDVIKETIATLGENISISRFSRFAIGESSLI